MCVFCSSLNEKRCCCCHTTCRGLSCSILPNRMMKSSRSLFLLSTIGTLQSFFVSSFISHRNGNRITYPSSGRKMTEEFSLRRGWKIAATIEEEEQSSERDLLIERRNLRFAGVGRLYTTTKDFSIVEEDRHLQVVERLSRATVLVVGLGGVGSWAAEAICRSGVGSLVLIDLDDICISNTNRQLHALSSTIGRMKIDEMKQRLQDINPDCRIQLIHDFVSPDNIDDILKSLPNITACLDAIDGAKAKTSLITACARYGIPMVTCGGSAGRTDPTKFVCDDLTRVQGDPLLAACRKDMRQSYGFEQGKSFQENKAQKPIRKWNIKAVCSTEPQKSLPNGGGSSSLRRCDGALGTACFVTGACGFVAAGEIISQIANDKLLVPRNFAGNVPRTSTH